MKNYECCFVDNKKASGLDFYESYVCETTVIPVVGDIIDLKEYVDEKEYNIIQENNTQYFVVEKRIIIPFSSDQSECYDAILFISAYNSK